MKRFVAIVCLFVLTMITSLPANAEWELPEIAENFTIRNGVSFGMSKADVLAVEQTNGNTADSETDCLLYKDIRFLGDDGIFLHHYFTNDDKLRSFAYTRMGAIAGTIHSFTDIFETVTDKYGEPMLTTELSPFSTAIWGEIPLTLFYYGSEWSVDTLSGNAVPSSHDGSLWISNYAVWLVKYNDCAVIIELAEVNKGDYLSLGYASISHEEMESWLAYRDSVNKETENSYNNDI